MYTLIRSAGARRALTREGPAAAVAFVTAELLYKFHSFALECLAFLATWLLVSWLASMILGVWRVPGAESPD